ncbi:MAG: sugar phosphate isomerase/epimerase [Clostridia bacterium]|nr:sugar phosphate isomerase/epimerase [Clostridia bacterium]
MHNVYCSTGALIGKPNGRDYRLLADCAKHIECDGFEFMMYGDWYSEYETAAGYILKNGISAPVFHIEKQVGELISRNNPGDAERAFGLFEINCKTAKLIQSHMLVLHLWGGIDSDKDISNNINAYKTLRGIADSYRLTLTVENVVCNIAEPFTHMLRLTEVYPDIKFTFDTKMAQFHRQLERLYTLPREWVAKHIAHMHVNDYCGGYMDWNNLKTLHLGEGNIDFLQFFEYVRKNYTGDFTIESTSFDKSGTIHFDAMNKDIRFVKEHLK